MGERRFSNFGGDKVDDREILRLFNIRDEKAISAAAEKYGAYLAKLAENITGSHQDAEEVVNDVLLKAWELIPPNSPERLSAFLGKLARNAAISRLRALRTDKRGNGELPMVLDEISELVSGGSDVEKEFESRELMREISAYIRKLPTLKRDLFVCRYWYCMSARELSERFGTSESSVTTTLCRVRAKLKAHLQRKGYDL